MSPDPAGDLLRLRGIAGGFPCTGEKLSHGMPMFFIERGRSFLWYWHDHHGDGRSAALVRTSGADEQGFLVEGDPELHFRPPYLGPSGWIAIRTDVAGTDWDVIAGRAATSWRMVAPRKLLELMQ